MLENLRKIGAFNTMKPLSSNPARRKRRIWTRSSMTSATGAGVDTTISSVKEFTFATSPCWTQIAAEQLRLGRFYARGVENYSLGSLGAPYSSIGTETRGMRLNTMVLLIGHIVMFGTFAVLWYYVPTDGRKSRFAGTTLEPYIVSAFFSAFALGGGMMTLGYLEYF